jgi:hypothetical protein
MVAVQTGDPALFQIETGFVATGHLAAWDKKIMLLSTNLSHLEGGATMVFFLKTVASKLR